MKIHVSGPYCFEQELIVNRRVAAVCARRGHDVTLIEGTILKKGIDVENSVDRAKIIIAVGGQDELTLYAAKYASILHGRSSVIGYCEGEVDKELKEPCSYIANTLADLEDVISMIERTR